MRETEQDPELLGPGNGRQAPITATVSHGANGEGKEPRSVPVLRLTFCFAALCVLPVTCSSAPSAHGGSAIALEGCCVVVVVVACSADASHVRVSVLYECLWVDRARYIPSTGFVSESRALKEKSYFAFASHEIPWGGDTEQLATHTGAHTT
eukprot:scaffold46066_cov41-Attheya_sp.AAC.3